ncbi:MAG TPA: hypothetical protein VJ021_09565 [Thermoplasmata archaeon]|nr:hypothetical protein [Thermoplasmata archaeon]
MPTKKRGKPKKVPARLPRRPRAAAQPRFIGRDASPVLDRYPPKAPGTAPKGPPPSPSSSTPSVTVSTPSLPPSPGTGAPSQPLITLERPFDVDEFSTLLGGTSIRITVPRDALPEVLRRVTEFMGFGIYVYSISVRPAATELLKGFVVELQRVDFSAEKGTWVPFVEKGIVDSPFGPSGDRT